MIERIFATPAAVELIQQLKSIHGPLLFHQSGATDDDCPLCLPIHEFQPCPKDVFVGKVGDCPFYLGEGLHEYWQLSQLTLDVAPGVLEKLSLESPLGEHFAIHARAFDPRELEELRSAQPHHFYRG
ncbi:MAG: DUF779 domain-containing protein [Pseudomonas sp.]